VAINITSENLKLKQTHSNGPDSNLLYVVANQDTITNNTSSYHNSNSENASSTHEYSAGDQGSTPAKQRRTSGQEIDLFSEMSLTKCASNQSKQEQLLKLQQLREENERLENEKETYYCQI
jgi:hypothetical protein